MKHRAPGFCRPFACILLTVAVIFCGAEWARAQGDGFERTFPQSKASVEKALKAMQSSTAGRLPVLNGFASAADHPMDSYQRGFYQAKFQVSAAPSGGSIVRVSVEVTAWHTDPVAARSGYELLTSNGRLEADLLDQLADQLAGKAPQAATGSPASSDSRPFPSMQRAGAGGASSSEQFPAEASSSPQTAAGQAAKTPDAEEGPISAPVPRLPQTSGGFSPSLAQGLARENTPAAGKKDLTDDDPGGLRAEAASLQEILKNQAHPGIWLRSEKTEPP